MTFEELRDKAISVRMAGGSVLRAELAAELVRQLDSIFDAGGWQEGDPAILADLRRLSCTLGQRVVVSAPQGSRQGEAVDIAPDGSLLVRFDGGMEAISSGEVSVRGLLGYT